MADEDDPKVVNLSAELKDDFAHSFRGLSQLAVETPDPAFWLARLDEIVNWLESPQQLPERLIDLLVTSRRASLDLDQEVLEAAMAGRVSPNKRLHILLTEFVCRSSEALIALGPPAWEALLRAYTAAAPGSRERYWLLVTLSRTGDEELAPFFEALREDDFDPEGRQGTLGWLHREFETRRAVHAFQRGGGEAIYAALQHENEWWRRQAASALTRMGDERAIEGLRSLLNDPSETVRNNARFGLDWLEQKRSGESPEEESK